MERARRLLYDSSAGHVLTVMIGLAGLSVVLSYLVGDGWIDLGVVMSLYAAVITILIFGWTLQDNVRLRRDAVDVAAVSSFLNELGKEEYTEDQLNEGQMAALAEKVGRPVDMVRDQIQLCLNPKTREKRHRLVLLFDGTIWRITIGGAAGGYNVQPLLHVAVNG
jgi:hypothetical protein